MAENNKRKRVLVVMAHPDESRPANPPSPPEPGQLLGAYLRRQAEAHAHGLPAAAWDSELARRLVRVSASSGTGASAASRLAATWMAQNGFPRDWAAASRACAAVTVGDSRPWICH